MVNLLKGMLLGKEASKALECKGKIIGMVIGLGAGMVAGYAVATCVSGCKCNSENTPRRYGRQGGNCNSMGEKIKKCGSNLVNKIVDTAAGEIKNTMYCDCDDNGAIRIPDEDENP